MDKSYRDALEKAYEYSVKYAEQVDELPAFPNEADLSSLSAFDEPLPKGETAPSEVIDML